MDKKAGDKNHGRISYRNICNISFLIISGCSLGYSLLKAEQ